MADGAAAVAAGDAGSAQTTQAGQTSQTEQTAQQQNANGGEAGKEKTDGKKEYTGRKRLMERYASLYPDRKFEGDDADNDLIELTADEFDKYDSEKAGYKEKSDKLNQLFHDYPDSAEIFRAMAVDKQHPFDYIIDHYGDILEDGLQSDENKAKIKQRREERLKQESERKENDEKTTNNIKESLRILGEWGKKRGLDEKTQADHFLKIRQAFNDFADGNISEETYELFLNGANYANDVARAREEGEVNGRNAKIEKEFQGSKRTSPPTLGGQGGGSEEYDENKKGGTFEMFGIPIKPKKK